MILPVSFQINFGGATSRTLPSVAANERAGFEFAQPAASDESLGAVGGRVHREIVDFVQEPYACVHAWTIPLHSLLFCFHFWRCILYYYGQSCKSSHESMYRMIKKDEKVQRNLFSFSHTLPSSLFLSVSMKKNGLYHDSFYMVSELLREEKSIHLLSNFRSNYFLIDFIRYVIWTSVNFVCNHCECECDL